MFVVFPGEAFAASLCFSGGDCGAVPAIADAYLLSTMLYVVSPFVGLFACVAKR
jgi:hypothetical protein